MIPRRTHEINSYKKELENLGQDRKRFQAQLGKLNGHRKTDDLIEKYRFYIKDLLQRPDSKAAMFCLAMTAASQRITLVKSAVFYNIKHANQYQTHHQSSKQKLLVVHEIMLKNETLQKSKAFQRILSYRYRSSDITNTYQDNAHRLLTAVNAISLKSLKLGWSRMLKAAYNKELLLRQQRITELQQQNTKLSQCLANRKSNNSTTLQRSDHQQTYQRLGTLEKLLKEKQKDIKNMVRAAKELQSKYERKVDKLEEQVNKMNHINLRLMDELEELRSRRGDISDILPSQPRENSMSLEIFNQEGKHKQVQMELSDKYLRQVICLKENIESIKTNFIGLLQNNLKVERSSLVNLMYLLDFNDEEKKMVIKIPYLAQLMS